MKVLVVVPAYNEQATIGDVIRLVPVGIPTVVIDDGSTDGTGVAARDAGATVVRHIMNRGLGGALRTGFLCALRNGFDAVITLDADGQHDPREILSFISALESGDDIVVGHRRAGDMPRVRQWFNRIARVMTFWLFGVRSVDTESGFRALSRNALEQMRLTSSRMDISSEIIAEAYRARLRIGTVPITVYYTNYSMSKGQSLAEGVRTAVRLLLKSISRIF